MSALHSNVARGEPLPDWHAAASQGHCPIILCMDFEMCAGFPDECGQVLQTYAPDVSDIPAGSLIEDAGHYLDVLHGIRHIDPHGWKRVFVADGGKNHSFDETHIGKNRQTLRRLFNGACRALLESPEYESVVGTPRFMTFQQTKKQMEKRLTPKLLEFNGGGQLTSIAKINDQHLMLMNKVIFEDSDEGRSVRDAFAAYDRNHFIARPVVIREALLARETFKQRGEAPYPVNIFWQITSEAQFVKAGDAELVVRPEKKRKPKGFKVEDVRSVQPSLFPGGPAVYGS